ncbi:hypothetical protein LINGRAPRIM_LOCUS2610 [Linum grandiflorum]
MPRRPKKNIRKEHQELEAGIVLSRKGLTMHCKSCLRGRHNARTCPKNVPARTIPARTTPRRATPKPKVPNPRSRNPICGKCKASGHNVRTCPRNQGVQVLCILHIILMHC